MEKIKEKVAPRRGNVSTYRMRRGHIVTVQSLLHRIGWPRFFTIVYSINRSSHFLKYNFLLKREEIKHFWRKISSFLWFSCVLDSIAHGLRQVNHESLQENVWIRSLNAERTSKKISDKYTTIKEIWGSIFTSIGLVVWFLRNPCNSGSLD